MALRCQRNEGKIEELQPLSSTSISPLRVIVRRLIIPHGGLLTLLVLDHLGVDSLTVSGKEFA